MSKNKGFTLIELLLYLILFTMIIGAIINMTIFLTSSSQATTAKLQLIEEANTTFEEIIRNLETGKSYNTTNSELNQTFSIIEFTGGDNGTDIIKFWTDETNFILKKQTNGGTIMNLHSDTIKIDRFNVTRINPSVLTPIFQISVDFSNDYNETFSLASSVNFTND